MHYQYITRSPGLRKLSGNEGCLNSTPLHFLRFNLRKAIAYIDGRNFYHYLNKFNIEGCHFDYRAFVSHFLTGKHIVDIKYYTALFPREISLEKHNRDDAFYKHIQQHQKINVILGRFRTDQIDGKKIAQEKGVDVRIATDLIFDAFYSAYDDAYIFSSDTDLLPAIKAVKQQFKQVKIFNPTFQPLNGFRKECDAVIPIYENVAKKFKSNEMMPTKKTLKDLEAKLKNHNIQK